MNKLIVILSMVSILLAIPSTIKASADRFVINGWQSTFLPQGVALQAEIKNCQDCDLILWERQNEHGVWDTLMLQFAEYEGDVEIPYLTDRKPVTGTNRYRAHLFDVNGVKTNTSNIVEVNWNYYINTQNVLWTWPNPLYPGQDLKINEVFKGDRILIRDLTSRVLVDYAVTETPLDSIVEITIPSQFGRRSWILIDCSCRFRRSARIFLAPQN